MPSRATGDDTRSLCTTVCKWTYLGHAHMQQLKEKDSRNMEACGWDDDFWEEIGLGDLIDGHHAKIGTVVSFFVHLFPCLYVDVSHIPGTQQKSRSLQNFVASSLLNYLRSLHLRIFVIYYCNI